MDVKYHPMDLAGARTFEAYDELVKKTSDIDVSILINNAGVPGTDSLHKLSKDLISQIFFVNAAAPMFLMWVFAERLLNRKTWSAIINVASFGGTVPLP